MGDFTFKAEASLKVTVRGADNEEAARLVALDHLHDCDTDFIRTDHFNPVQLVAEIHIEKIT